MFNVISSSKMTNLAIQEFSRTTRCSRIKGITSCDRKFTESPWHSRTSGFLQMCKLKGKRQLTDNKSQPLAKCEELKLVWLNQVTFCRTHSFLGKQRTAKYATTYLSWAFSSNIIPNFSKSSFPGPGREPPRADLAFLLDGGPVWKAQGSVTCWQLRNNEVLKQG